MPYSIDSIKVYEQQNAIEKNYALSRYYISKEYYKKMKSFTVEPGDIIVSCAGTIGEIYTLPNEADIGVINQALMRIKPNYNIIVHDYFIYSFEKMITDFSNKFSNGSAIKNIPPFSDLKKQTLMLPCLEEQQKIVVFLHKISDRILTQKKIIEEYKLLKKSICNDYNRINCTKYKIKDLGIIGRGRVINSIEISNQSNPKYPVYSSQTLNNGIMGYLDGYDFDGEYITWTTDGANAGTVFYHNEKFNCTNVCGTIKVTNRIIHPFYLSLVLQYECKKYVSLNLANPKLMNNTMASIEVKVPSFEYQNKIINIIKSINKKIDDEEKVLQLYQKQKDYLLNHMFI